MSEEKTFLCEFDHDWDTCSLTITAPDVRAAKFALAMIALTGRVVGEVVSDRLNDDGIWAVNVIEEKKENRKTRRVNSAAKVMERMLALGAELMIDEGYTPDAVRAGLLNLSKVVEQGRVIGGPDTH